MRTAQLISESYGRVETKEEEAHSSAPEKAIRFSWLSHPLTEEFFLELEKKQKEFVKLAIDTAASGGDYVSICRLASKAKAIEEVMTYGRRE